MAGSSGLSDVLRDMAEGPPPESMEAPKPAQSMRSPTRSGSKSSSRAVKPTRSVADEDEVIVAEVDDVEEPRQAARPRGTPTVPRQRSEPTASAPRRKPAPKPASNHTMKEVGACLFTTLSFLMLLVAGWGTLILLGFEVMRHDQEGARTMALVSQVFYLLALIGLIYSTMLFVQISRDKKAEKQAAAKRAARR